MENHRELSTKEVAEILQVSTSYVTVLAKQGKLKAHPRTSGGWCGNPGLGYDYQEVMAYFKQRDAKRRLSGKKPPDPALLTELRAALEDFQAAKALLDEQTERLRTLAAKLGA